MKEQGKLIRKRPTIKVLSHKKIKTTIYVKSSTPYVSALKRITKFLDNLEKHGSTYVSVLGMGKAVEKTLSLGCHFEQNKNKRVHILTKTIDLLDEVLQEVENEEEEGQEAEIEDEDKDTILKKRRVCGVELKIYP